MLPRQPAECEKEAWKGDGRRGRRTISDGCERAWAWSTGRGKVSLDRRVDLEPARSEISISTKPFSRGLPSFRTSRDLRTQLWRASSAKWTRASVVYG